MGSRVPSKRPTEWKYRARKKIRWWGKFCPIAQSVRSTTRPEKPFLFFAATISVYICIFIIYYMTIYIYVRLVGSRNCWTSLAISHTCTILHVKSVECISNYAKPQRRISSYSAIFELHSIQFTFDKSARDFLSLPLWSFSPLPSTRLIRTMAEFRKQNIYLDSEKWPLPKYPF